MSKPKILIVGCGAVGLAQGYHLSAAADITYLVRPGRSPAFQPPKKLYDYKTDALHTFDNYRLIESTSEVANEDFYFVFDTLDGHTARSEGGRKTLEAVGALIRDHTATFVVYDAIGLDMGEYYSTTMGISKDRLILAASMLAHQPTKTISVPPKANTGLIAQADLLFAHVYDNRALLVINSQPKLTKKVVSLYEKLPTMRAKVMPGFLDSSGMMMLAMLQLVAWNVDGYHPLPEFQRNKELWSLMIKAQKEILTLPRYGWTGWLISFVLGPWATAKIMAGPAEDALPLPYHEFNAFHHGAKVAKQDVQVLEHLVAEGDRVGHKVEALREVCKRGGEALKKVV